MSVSCVTSVVHCLHTLQFVSSLRSVDDPPARVRMSLWPHPAHTWFHALLTFSYSCRIAARVSDLYSVGVCSSITEPRDVSLVVDCDGDCLGQIAALQNLDVHHSTLHDWDVL